MAAKLRPLDKIHGQKKFTLEFPTQDLLKKFDLPTLDPELEPPDVDMDLTNTIDLTVSRDSDGDLTDANGKKLSDEVTLEIRQAASVAEFSGTTAVYNRRILAALEQTLETFSDYRYDYFYMTDDGERSTSGIAKGVLTIDAKPDVTTLTVADGIVHIIHHCITGYGMFYATDNFEGETLRHYVETRFGWLKHHWEIHGDSMPKPDLDNIDDFDRSYFITLLKEIEKDASVGGPYALVYKSRKR